METAQIAPSCPSSFPPYKIVINRFIIAYNTYFSIFVYLLTDVFLIYHPLNNRKFTTFSDKTEYREVCWNLNDRGAVGETILHLCLLNANSILADLAKRLLKFYPKLINDIYISDEYYGKPSID